MASIAFLQDYGIVQNVDASDYPITKIIKESVSASFYPIDYSTQITYSSAQSRFIKQNINSTITQSLPFRIRFTEIGLPDVYGPGNPAPIGIAVIGSSFYVM